MTDLPHVIAGNKTTEELIRIVEAYQRDHDMPVAGLRLNAELCNKAIDWWNGLQASPVAGLYCLDSECDCREQESGEPTVTLVRAAQTCFACPAQWDAWDADGQTYYLRFRSGIGTVEAVPTPTATAESLNSARLVAKFRYGDSLLGSIELDLFCELAGIRLAENAEVM